MKMTETDRGDKVARTLWKWVCDSKAVELVPWVSDPKSDSYDPIKVAEHCGWKRAINEAEQMMRDSSESVDEGL